MAVQFLGFPRALAARALRPGRWFVPAGPTPQLCLMTGLGEGAAATVLTFSLGRLDGLEFRTRILANLPEPFSSVEDEVVFSPGDGESLRLWPARQGPYVSGALLRLADGDIGIGFAERLQGRVITVSLTTGQAADGVDLVFERWSLHLRRGASETLIGRFRPDLRTWQSAQAPGVESRPLLSP
jgi:hypothetical protein